MGKYVIMQNMRELPCYGNVNARLVYMHVAMGCDISTYTYTTSLRRLATELGLTLDAVRHAVKCLERDALLSHVDVDATAPQPAPQSAPRRTPHATTFIIRRSDNVSTTSITTNDTTSRPTDKKNKNQEEASHTRASVGEEELAEVLEKELGVSARDAGAWVTAFLDRQELNGHTWSDGKDMKAHAVAWVEKRIPKKAVRPKSVAAADQKAREEEYQRAREEEARKSDKQRRWEELQRIREWYQQGIKEGDFEYSRKMAAAWEEKKAEYMNLYVLKNPPGGSGT